MPVITQIGISDGKPCAIAITVSEEVYMSHKDQHRIPNPIPADAFRYFLSSNKIPFEQIDSATVIYSKDIFAVALWKDATFFDASDIKNALKPCPTKTYEDFIDWYSSYLKGIS